MTYEFMTDSVWKRVGPLLPPRNTFGRPRCTDRDVLEGILWVLKTGRGGGIYQSICRAPQPAGDV
jgi:hypothetical protein